MNISANSIVSNSDMIKNYKTCRDLAQSNGKIFILKNNQPDSVLFSIEEYERIAVFIEYLETIEDKDIAKITELLPVQEKKKTHFFDQLTNNNGNQSPEK